MNTYTNDEDLLGGTKDDEAETLLGGEAAKKPSAKKAKTKPAKKKAEKLFGTKTVTKPTLGNNGETMPAKKTKAKPAKAAKKPTPADTAPPAKKTKAKPAKAAKKEPTVARVKKVRTPGTSSKPTLSNSRIAVLAFFSAQNNKWATREDVAKGVLGAKKATAEDIKTFIGGEIVPMVRNGLLEFDKQTDTIRPNGEKYAIRSKSLLSFIKHVPQDANKGLSAGVIGGKVWGTKDEKWVNVRFGRAAGALLKNLAAVGAVGHVQEFSDSPKLWYRLPVM